MTGEAVFNAVGCAACHHPSFTTADDPGLEAPLRNRVIRPYSDFLLHDMGAAGDGIVQGDAGRTELRTPQLWGLRVRARLWHDGRFADPDIDTRVEAAIAEHGADGSEGQAAAAAWAALPSADRAAALRFLRSLGQREFDADGDGLVVTADFGPFAACLAGGGPYAPDDPCAISDIDVDGDVDEDDYASFMIAFEGTAPDCNGNGTSDFDDIIFGGSADANANGVPDECELCPGDADGSGVVDFGDILVILADWGACEGPLDPCLGDLDESGIADFGDVLIVLSTWGACP
jgi:hypothetical protein